MCVHIMCVFVWFIFLQPYVQLMQTTGTYGFPFTQVLTHTDRHPGQFGSMFYWKTLNVPLILSFPPIPSSSLSLPSHHPFSLPPLTSHPSPPTPLILSFPPTPSSSLSLPPPHSLILSLSLPTLGLWVD